MPPAVVQPYMPPMGGVVRLYCPATRPIPLRVPVRHENQKRITNTEHILYETYAEEMLGNVLKQTSARKRNSVYRKQQLQKQLQQQKQLQLQQQKQLRQQQSGKPVLTVGMVSKITHIPVPDLLKMTPNQRTRLNKSLLLYQQQQEEHQVDTQLATGICNTTLHQERQQPMMASLDATVYPTGTVCEPHSDQLPDEMNMNITSAKEPQAVASSGTLM